jgi:hypothetical protein
MKKVPHRWPIGRVGSAGRLRDNTDSTDTVFRASNPLFHPATPVFKHF